MLDLRSTSLPPDPNDNYVKHLYILCTIFPVLATIAVALRFIARRLNKAGFWWDDWTALLALLIEWIDYSTIIQAIKYGKGRHSALLNPQQITGVRYWSYLFAIFYTAIPPTVKVSALLLYKRVFSCDRFSRLVSIMLVVVSCWGIAMVFISAFGCSPVSSFWTGHGKCIDEHAWVLGYGITNIVLDFMVWVMPIPRVWRLQLPRGQKITLTGIFVIGLTDCVLAIIRLAGSALSLGDSDTSYSWAPAMWWCVIHTSLGIIVISAPTMRVLFMKAGKRLLSNTSSKRSVGSSVTVTEADERPSKCPVERLYELDDSFTEENDSDHPTKL